MIDLKKLVLLQNVALVISVIAFVCSIFSMIFVSQHGFNEKKTTDIEKNIKSSEMKIIKIDNIATKTDATDGRHDNEYEILFKTKKEDKQNKDKSIDNGVNIIIGENKTTKSDQSDKLLKTEKELKKTINNDHSQEIRQIVDKQNLKNDKISSIKDNNAKDVKKNITSLGDTFVIQVGAFKKKQMAEQQCQAVKAIIKDKVCKVVSSGKSIFRSMVFVFKTNSEALETAKRLSNKLKIECIVKKNVL